MNKERRNRHLMQGFHMGVALYHLRQLNGDEMPTYVISDFSTMMARAEEFNERLNRHIDQLREEAREEGK